MSRYYTLFFSETANVGAVAGLRRIKPAMSVARRVLDNTHHSILVGDLATDFAVQMGFAEESLSTNRTQEIWEDWKARNCQPNFWTVHYVDIDGENGRFHAVCMFLFPYRT